MKILVIGSHGMLGRDLVNRLSNLPDPKNLQDLAKEMDTNIKEKKMGYYIDEKTLLQAYTEITKKIARNNELTQGDMKLLKLWMYIKEGKTDISFVDIKEYKENTAIFSKLPKKCDLPLFQSKSKFESGTGWPSYFEPINPEHINERADNSFGMERVEVLC